MVLIRHPQLLVLLLCLSSFSVHVNSDQSVTQGAKVLNSKGAAGVGLDIEVLDKAAKDKATEADQAEAVAAQAEREAVTAKSKSDSAKQKVIEAKQKAQETKAKAQTAKTNANEYNTNVESAKAPLVKAQVDAGEKADEAARAEAWKGHRPDGITKAAQALEASNQANRKVKDTRAEYEEAVKIKADAEAAIKDDLAADQAVSDAERDAGTADIADKAAKQKADDAKTKAGIARQAANKAAKDLEEARKVVKEAAEKAAKPNTNVPTVKDTKAAERDAKAAAEATKTSKAHKADNKGPQTDKTAKDNTERDAKAESNKPTGKDGNHHTGAKVSITVPPMPDVNKTTTLSATDISSTI
eukprot:Tbor_TRINITY_DN5420_c1_g1::TRINITY_DN5420_c1_g1_i6::g.24628::m.24628